jgi:N-acetylglucosaminylphosphatidylinositol deacetylase
VFILFGLSSFIPHLLLVWRTRLKTDLARMTEILIVFAHPDDETMFFLPLILLARKLGVSYHLLCLTSGDFDGLGAIRKKEFDRVGKRLKALKAEILDEDGLRDGPTRWETVAVTSVIDKYLREHPKIDGIFTFDDYGVSGHPNHISVHNGVKSMKTTIPRYCLSSVSLLQKYLPPLDLWLSLAFSGKDSLMAVNTDEPFLSAEIMKLYASQNVWFRRLFSFFSRYSYINTFHRI